MNEMNRSERERVVEKIKKLFALAENNPSQSEAVSAALKAQKLLADYDIKAEELADTDGGEKVVSILSEEFSGDLWRAKLAVVVADNFRCKCYRQNAPLTERQRARRAWGYRVVGKHQIVFIGYRADANAALTAYEGLVRIGSKLLAKAKRDARELGYSTRGLKNGFLFGFCDGVRRELEKQSRELMLTVPSAVLEAYGSVKLRNINCTYSKYGYDRGYEAGRDAVRSGRVGAARPSTLLTA